MGTRVINIGLFGGTFDPVHIGHMIWAERVRELLGLEKVIFMPAGSPPHKHLPAVSDRRLRYQMVEAAISGNPYFELSPLEVKARRISFTVETLTELRRLYPDPDYELFLIIGADSLLDLENWKSPDRLFDFARVVVMNRPGFTLDQVESRYRRKIIFVEEPLIGISSTDIRRRVRNGDSIRYLVPENVEKFIREHGLYQS